MIVQQPLLDVELINWSVAIGLAFLMLDRGLHYFKMFRDRKNGQILDPESGDPISVPALNFRMLAEVVKCQREQADALRKVADCLEDIDQKTDELTRRPTR